jgi:hypothetical protein
VLFDAPENQHINDRVVGFVLARPDFHQSGGLFESYIGVTVDSRRRGIFVSLMQKMKTNGVPS